MPMVTLREAGASLLAAAPADPLEKGGGPFIGPHGGKWADAKHTIAWKDLTADQVRSAARSVARLPEGEAKAWHQSMVDHHEAEAEAAGHTQLVYHGLGGGAPPVTRHLGPHGAAASRHGSAIGAHGYAGQGAEFGTWDSARIGVTPQQYRERAARKAIRTTMWAHGARGQGMDAAKVKDPRDDHWSEYQRHTQAAAQNPATADLHRHAAQAHNAAAQAEYNRTSPMPRSPAATKAAHDLANKLSQRAKASGKRADAANTEKSMPDNETLKKALADGAGRLGVINYHHNTRSGDALGRMGALVEGSAPATQPSVVIGGGAANPEVDLQRAQGATLQRSFGAFAQYQARGLQQADLSRAALVTAIPLKKGGGPFIGPHGGKWADAKHTIAWNGDHAGAARAHGAQAAEHRKLQGEAASTPHGIHPTSHADADDHWRAAEAHEAAQAHHEQVAETLAGGGVNHPAHKHWSASAASASAMARRIDDQMRPLTAPPAKAVAASKAAAGGATDHAAKAKEHIAIADTHTDASEAARRAGNVAVARAHHNAAHAHWEAAAAHQGVTPGAGPARRSLARVASITAQQASDKAAKG